jgi:tetratricopeptide (TPR) repeat protein
MQIQNQSQADYLEESAMADQEAAQKANAMLGEAVLLRAAGKQKEARAKCHEALKLHPDNPEAFQVLGDLYAQAGLLEAALEAYRRVLEIDPSQTAVETRIARVALRLDKFNQQRKLARDLVEGKIKREQPRSPATAALLSLFLPGLGQSYNHQWLKAAGFICVYVLLFMTTIVSALRNLVSLRASASVIDLFSAIGIFFTPPALYWTFLLGLFYVYSVIDASLAAAQPPPEESAFL